jgi:hypothetical protein
MSERDEPDLSEILSGESGIVAGKRARSKARIGDIIDELALRVRLVPQRLSRAARDTPTRDVLIAGVYRRASAANIRVAAAELQRSRHRVTFALGSLDEKAPTLCAETLLDHLRGGKFENLNSLLAARSTSDPDWFLFVDDDVELPQRFLDRFLGSCERFGFQLAQPALTRTSHAGWRTMRRCRGTIARTTRMVEIGPLTAIHRSVAPELLPFPRLRMGWGLDSHWGALAWERGWRVGVIDATPVKHELRLPASRYDRHEAEREAAAFLASRPHLDRRRALTVVERHRGLR